MNVAVVAGNVAGEVHVQVQDDGATAIVSFDLRVEAKGGPSAVPVSWIGPTGRAPDLEKGATVTAIGSVRKRFYRRGGATVSRTDLLADRVIVGPPGRSRAARKKAADTMVGG